MKKILSHSKWGKFQRNLIWSKFHWFIEERKITNKSLPLFSKFKSSNHFYLVLYCKYTLFTIFFGEESWILLLHYCKENSILQDFPPGHYGRSTDLIVHPNLSTKEDENHLDNIQYIKNCLKKKKIKKIQKEIYFWKK